MTLEQARDFLAGVADKLGRRPVLCSGHLIKDSLGTAVDPFFDSHRLWFAQYGPAPAVQASWGTYWLWQYTDSTKGPAPNTVSGIPSDAKGNFDCNMYDRTQADLAGEWAV